VFGNGLLEWEPWIMLVCIPCPWNRVPVLPEGNLSQSKHLTISTTPTNTHSIVAVASIG
jgi:hypothetical protein